MATLTPAVLIISRDPEVKQVASTLQADGLSARAVATPRELQRALSLTKTRFVAVLDSEILSDAGFSPEQLEKLESVPTLVLQAPEAERQPDGERTSIEEFVRKPIANSVLALRIKALILSAGMSLPTPKAAPAVPEQGPLDISSDQRGQLTLLVPEAVR